MPAGRISIPPSHYADAVRHFRQQGDASAIGMKIGGPVNGLTMIRD
jgi:hypothetical protein